MLGGGPTLRDQIIQMLVEGLELAFGIDSDEAIDVDISFLPDPVSAVGGLVFPGGIPPTAIVKDMVGGGDGEPDPGDIRREDEDFEARLLGKLGEGFATLRTDSFSTGAVLAIDDFDIESESVVQDSLQNRLHVA